MLYGVMNNPRLDLKTEIELVGQSPFDYMEITLDPPCAHYRDVMAGLDEYAALLRAQNLNVVCHMPTFVYLADLSPHLREASIIETVGAMETAFALGAQKIVQHPPFFSGMARHVRERSVELALETLDFLLAKSYEFGFDVCLENLDGRFDELGSDPESMARLLERYDDAFMTFDVAHAFVRGGNKAIERFLELCHGRIKHVHISDNWGKNDEHLPLGAGGLDAALVVNLLKRYGYNNTVTFEVFAPNRAYRDVSLEVFKKLWDAE